MKLHKFQIQAIVGHLQGGNYEFKIIVWTIQKNIRKIFGNDCVMKRIPF